MKAVKQHKSDETCVNGESKRSEDINWECVHCGNWESSTEHGEPPECAAGHGDMVNRFASSDKSMNESELRTWVPY